MHLKQGKELPAKDLSGTSDPYVRVTLLPDKKHRLETKIKRRTLNPRWNETFYFEGFPVQKLQSRILHLHVFDYDRFSRDDSIGEVFLPLCQVRNSFTFHLPEYMSYLGRLHGQTVVLESAKAAGQGQVRRIARLALLSPIEFHSDADSGEGAQSQGQGYQRKIG